MADTSTLRLTVSSEWLAHEVMRFGLNEIVRLRADDPWGFDANKAASIAKETLEAVEKLEAGR